MTRPRLLDLFCGAGGCSVGYHRAGFDVTGVDIKPHSDYPFEMVVADAMEVLRDVAYLAQFDAVHASPPCQYYTRENAGKAQNRHPALVEPALALLRTAGRPWIVENVPGAPLPDAVMICGQAMGLSSIKRHRLFASSELLMSPGCGCSSARPWGVYCHANGSYEPPPNKGRVARNTAHARELLGIDWMTSWADLTEAIPPAYTEYLGAQLIDQLVLA